MRIPALSMLLAACASPAPAPHLPTTPWSASACGDGVLDQGEECDEGAANGDAAGACRQTCLLPICGDGITDLDESCDDANALGGDGCTPDCGAEEGQLETEPNDTWDTAEAATDALLHGSLGPEDQDCFALEVAECAALSARLLGPCPEPATLQLHGPSGAQVASGGPDAEGCAVLDPIEQEGARFVDAGTWAVCLQPVLGEPIPAYSLEFQTIAPQPGVYIEDPGDDPDADGLPDRCDADRDGDGVANDEDNCPDHSNGPDTGDLAPDADGFITTWLSIGPFTGRSSPETCLPSEDHLVAEDDALALPRIGDPDVAGEVSWRVFWSNGSRIDLRDPYGDVDAPREAYTVAYVQSPEPRDAVLATGLDDGARVWFDGAEVLSITSCQGTNVDQFSADVSLTGDWQPVLIKVYDQGGGWGLYARFLDTSGAPMTDLAVSLDPSGSWSSNQSDADGDGIGDVCDDEP